MSDTLRRADGFTLVEVMIAMFLLAFIVGELAMVDVGAKRSSNLAKRITKANALVDDAIEKSRNRAYAKQQQAAYDWNGDGDTTDPEDEACVMSGNVATCTSNGPIEGLFTRVRVVTPLDAANAPTTLTASGKVDVVATVTFADARGNPQRISAASIMTKF